MDLKLNETIEPYKEFYGNKIEQMPLLIAQGRIPLSIAGFMERRLHSKRPDWKDNYFDSSDAIAYHPDKKFKIVLDSKHLRELNLKKRLSNGALVLQNEIYEILQGIEFKIEELDRITKRGLSLEEAKSHPIWQVVARNQNLLNEYVDSMFAEMKKSFNFYNNMGFYIAPAQDIPTLRSLTLDRLGSWSRLIGRGNLNHLSGRLVGLALDTK